MKKVFMFSGLGSQYHKMGHHLYQDNAQFQSYIKEIDQMARDICDFSVIDYLYHQNFKQSDDFSNTLPSYISLFALEVAVAQTLKSNAILPDAIYGSSLGTIIGSVIAGCISPENALKCLHKQANLFERECPEGRMLAVLDSIEVFHFDTELQDISELSGINFDKNFLLTTSVNHIDRVKEILQESGHNFQVMPVSRPYHSSMINSLKGDFLNTYSFLGQHKPNVPFYCSSTQVELNCIDAQKIWNAIRKPIRILDSITALDESGPHHYIDCGPSGTLATICKYALPQTSGSKITQLMSPFKRTSELVL